VVVQLRGSVIAYKLSSSGLALNLCVATSHPTLREYVHPVGRK